MRGTRAKHARDVSIALQNLSGESAANHRYIQYHTVSEAAQRNNERSHAHDVQSVPFVPERSKMQHLLLKRKSGRDATTTLSFICAPRQFGLLPRVLPNGTAGLPGFTAPGLTPAPGLHEAAAIRVFLL